MGASPFVSLCNTRQLSAVSFSVIVLACAWAYFWGWWVVYVHSGLFNSSWTISDGLLSAIWALQTFDTIFAYSLLAAAKTPDARGPIPCFRVAMIVTRAPSEPFDVVKKTLMAMLSQTYPYSYDVWLADERFAAVSSADALVYRMHCFAPAACDVLLELHTSTAGPPRKSQHGVLKTASKCPADLE